MNIMMINGNSVRSLLNKKEEKEKHTWVKELHALYDLKPKIESIISALISSKAIPELNGVRFYDDLFGEEFLQFKSSLTCLPLDIVADHICNWLCLNEYDARFSITKTHDGKENILFIVLWYCSKYPRPIQEN